MRERERDREKKEKVERAGMNLGLGWADREGVGMAARGGGRLGWLPGFDARGNSSDRSQGEGRGWMGQLWREEVVHSDGPEGSGEAEHRPEEGGPVTL